MARLIETIKCDIPLPNNKWGAPTPHAMCQLSSPLILSFRRQLGRRKYGAYTIGALAQIYLSLRSFSSRLSLPFSVRDIRIVLCCGLQEHIIPDHFGTDCNRAISSPSDYLTFPLHFVNSPFLVLLFQPSSHTMHPITTLLCIASSLLPQAVSAAPPLPKVFTQQSPPTYPPSTSNPLKVPGESPAYYCSDPSDDIFQIRRFDFLPINPRM